MDTFIIVLVLLIVLALGGVSVWWFLLRKKHDDDEKNTTTLPPATTSGPMIPDFAVRVLKAMCSNFNYKRIESFSSMYVEYDDDYKKLIDGADPYLVSFKGALDALQNYVAGSEPAELHSALNRYYNVQNSTTLVPPFDMTEFNQLYAQFQVEVNKFNIPCSAVPYDLAYIIITNILA